MLSNKTILFFVVKCLTIYLLLVVVATPALKLESACSAVVCATGNLLYPNTKWTSGVNEKTGESLVKLNLKTTMNGKQVSRTGTLDKMKNWVLMPFLLLVALLLALPFGWKRLLKTFLLGVLGMWIYLAIFLKWSISYGHALAAGVAPEDTLFGEVFNSNVGHLTIIPVLIWAIVAFRQADWKELISGDWIRR